MHSLSRRKVPVTITLLFVFVYFSFLILVSVSSMSGSKSTLLSTREQKSTVALSTSRWRWWPGWSRTSVGLHGETGLVVSGRPCPGVIFSYLPFQKEKNELSSHAKLFNWIGINILMDRSFINTSVD